MKQRLKNLLPTALLLIVSAGLIIVGAAQGQAAQVLAKAVKICLECVGIG
ncbi:MAG: thioredoxin [Clostridia bacterium]|nr:thioredoxin [Clostridia bacterium]